MSIFMIWLVVRLIFLSVAILSVCFASIVAVYKIYSIVRPISTYFKSIYIKQFRGIKFDPDIVIISSMFGLYSLLTVLIWKYAEEPSLGLQIQFTGISLGCLAAIIAFRNYRRKSGVELLANYESNWDHLYGWKVKSVTISNLKDKKIQILEIYLLLDNELPLLVESYKDKPIILDGYVTEKIIIPPATSYIINNTPLNLDSCFSYGKNKLLIVTPEKIISPKRLLKPTSDKLSGDEVFAHRHYFLDHNGDKKVFPFTLGYVLTISVQNQTYYIYIVTDKENYFIKHHFFDQDFKRLRFNGRRAHYFEKDLQGSYIEDSEDLYELIFAEEKQYFDEEFYLQEDLKIIAQRFVHERDIGSMLTFKFSKTFKVQSSFDKNNLTGKMRFSELSK